MVFSVRDERSFNDSGRSERHRGSKRLHADLLLGADETEALGEDAEDDPELVVGGQRGLPQLGPGGGATHLVRRGGGLDLKYGGPKEHTIKRVNSGQAELYQG